MDNRIIDLDLDNPILPDFFKNLKQPINMTLCAGDGFQFNLIKGELEKENITDIEWYTTSRQGFRREDKPTTIFITAKNYARNELELNKQYLRSHPELQVILLVYKDVYNHKIDKIPKWKENLINLFPESINNIYEDVGCYGDKLDLKTLSIILREGGIYHMENYPSRVKKFIKELHHDYYKDYRKYFTINLEEQPPYKIIKDNNNVLILPSGGKKKKTNKSKKTRKNNKTRKTKKRRKH